MARIKGDKYYSPEILYKWLQEKLDIRDSLIFDPCCGILHPTEEAFCAEEFDNIIIQNDIDPDISADYYLDAAKYENWEQMTFEGLPGFDWTITNPPYQTGMCELIVLNSLKFSREGVAMLLRLSWLEPCFSRRRALSETINGLSLKAVYPVNPRPRFDPSKNGTDNTTVAWFIWTRGKTLLPPFQFCTDWNK